MATRGCVKRSVSKSNGAPHVPSAFTRSPLHLRSPNGDPACRCPKREPLSTVPSSWSPGPKLMAQEFRALTPSPEAMGPDGGCHDKTDEMSPPAPVSSDSRGHQTNQLPCSCDGLPGQN
jgi:hypothetical protein